MISGAGFDAVVLAGGLARRFEGASKPDVVVDGRRMLEHSLAAVKLARRVAVVAPDDVDLPADPRLVRTMEDPPRGGPAAALAAGLAVLDGDPPGPAGDQAAPDGDLAGAVVALSCDVPRVGPAIPRLVAALASSDERLGGVCLATPRPGGGTRTQYLAAAYRRPALEAALDAVAADRGGLTGASLREVVARLEIEEVPARGDEGADVDSWADLQELEIPKRHLV